MGVYGSKDTGGLYTSDKPKRKKKNNGNNGFIVIVLICIGAFAYIYMNPGIIPADIEVPLTPLKALTEQPKTIQQSKGTRTLPAVKGDAIQGILTDEFGLDCIVEVELLDVKKKEEALDFANNLYTYVELGDNQDYLFAKFRVKYVKNNSTKDMPLKYHWGYFSYGTSDYKKYSYNMGLVAGEGLLESVDLYEGTEHEGWICLYVNKDDPNPKAVFLDYLWFDL